MKNLFSTLLLSVTLAAGEAVGQEHKHEERKEEGKAPAQKGNDPAKAENKKCCEAMEKTGETREGTKGEAEAKQEKMKAMKEKMAEKMKGRDGMKTKDMSSDEKASNTSKDAQQH